MTYIDSRVESTIVPKEKLDKVDVCCCASCEESEALEPEEKRQVICLLKPSTVVNQATQGAAGLSCKP